MAHHHSENHPVTKKSRKQTEGTPAGTARFSWILILPAGVACLLGGGNREALFAAVLLSVGFVVWTHRPLLIVRHKLQIAITLFAVWGLTAWLPYWFTLRGGPEWRRVLTGELGVELLPLVSPQPWMSLGVWFLVLSGAAFAFLLASLSFSLEARRQLLEACAGLAALMAALSFFSHWTGVQIPGWESETGFGPFPSRNQTGNLFAISSVLAGALAFDAFNDERRRTGVLWAGVLLLLVMGCLFTTSRAALLVAFGALATWGIFISFTYKKSTTLVAVSLSLLLILSAGVFGMGGKTIDRLLPHTKAAQGEEMRLALAKDVLRMTLDAPLAGVGLGNFEAVFPFYRTASAAEARVLHPDSDWLMLLAEMGWPALFLAGWALYCYGRRVLPMARISGRTLRAAAACAAAGFAVHAAFDISGHRPATIFFAITCAAAGLHPGAHHRPLAFRWVKTLRAVGGTLLVVGVAYAGAALGFWLVPGPDTSERLEQRAATAVAAGETDRAVQLCDYGLQFAPLKWELYFTRGAAEIASGAASEARADFRRARFLEPFHPAVPFQEGFLWWPNFPASAFSAWREALERTTWPPENLFHPIRQRVGTDPRWHEELSALTEVRQELWLDYVRGLEPKPFARELATKRAENPSLSFLTEAHRKLLFISWVEKLGLADLLAALPEQPGWTDSAWFWRAKAMAEEGRYEEAYLFSKRYIDAAKIPVASIPDSPVGYEARLRLEPGDYSLALGLIRYYEHAHQPEEVLRITRGLPGDAPHYFRYLSAEAAASLRRWREAWESLEAYVSHSGLR